MVLLNIYCKTRTILYLEIKLFYFTLLYFTRFRLCCVLYACANKWILSFGLTFQALLTAFEVRYSKHKRTKSIIYYYLLLLLLLLLYLSYMIIRLYIRICQPLLKWNTRNISVQNQSFIIIDCFSGAV